MHEQFLRKAIKLAIDRMNQDAGGPFGALIVRSEEIIGEGWNCVTSKNDPTAHAEVNAIRMACERIQNFSLAGCTIYSSCEPCPMCLAAIYWARIDRIFYAASCKDAAAAGFDDGNFYRELCLPPKQRVLPAEQLLREEAKEPFRMWAKKEDRLEY